MNNNVFRCFIIDFNRVSIVLDLLCIIIYQYFYLFDKLLSFWYGLDIILEEERYSY